MVDAVEESFPPGGIIKPPCAAARRFYRVKTGVRKQPQA
jgi:hypothetical protein